MANTKTTQREYFTQGIALAKANGKDELAKFFESRIELLDKKSSNKKPTKTQTENVELKNEILEVLANAEKPITVSEIIKTSESLADLSNQKVSALVKQLVDSGEVVKTIEKKVSYFSVAPDTDEVA